MAGRPPRINVERDENGNLIFTINKCPSVPLALVQLNISHLCKVGNLRKVTVTHGQGQIQIVIDRPATVTNDARTRSYKNWHLTTETIIKTMITCIQASKSGDQFIKRVRALKLVA